MFNYLDYFTREELLSSLASTAYLPAMLGQDRLFETRNLSGTLFAVETMPDDDVVAAAPMPRGAPGKPLALNGRKVYSFEVGSYAWDAAVLADEVLNSRGAGLAAMREVLVNRRDQLTAKARRQADWQLEYLRVDCVNHPSNDMGTAPAPAVVGFGANDTLIRSGIHAAIVIPMESALGGLPYSGLTAYCSNEFWVGAIESKTIRETYLNQIAANELRNAPPDSFQYAGVLWKRYRDSGSVAIETGMAKIVPTGVPELFLQAFAPNDTMQSVGAGELGQPYYLDSELMDGDKGIKMRLSTHPAMVCTRPAAVITVKLS